MTSWSAITKFNQLALGIRYIYACFMPADKIEGADIPVLYQDMPWL